MHSLRHQRHQHHHQPSGDLVRFSSPVLSSWREGLRGCRFLCRYRDLSQVVGSVSLLFQLLLMMMMMVCPGIYSLWDYREEGKGGVAGRQTGRGGGGTLLSHIPWKRKSYDGTSNRHGRLFLSVEAAKWINWRSRSILLHWLGLVPVPVSSSCCCFWFCWPRLIETGNDYKLEAVHGRHGVIEGVPVEVDANPGGWRRRLVAFMGKLGCKLVFIPAQPTKVLRNSMFIISSL